ncbi:MAG: hypothetical protein LBJ39_06525 [Tannerellaceae bacterium]|nr:hypothetical protein [Tannerellaceae bacterium]
MSKGSVHVYKGSVFVSKGSVFVSKGSVHVSKGSVFVSKGSVHVSKGFVFVSRGSVFPWAFSYTLISCANADKKRLKVKLLASFPVASCQAALALLTLCLSCSMAVRTASLYSQ